MKNSKLGNINNLLHTNWTPGKGDFVKENSLEESRQFKKRQAKQNLIIGSLIAAIIVVFLTAVVLLSV
jgi:hypothetical protein